MCANELKTSEEWQRLCKVTILDPDGWDRKNYRYSWCEEKITRSEWERRMLTSTVLGFSNDSIWKDL